MSKPPLAAPSLLPQPQKRNNQSRNRGAATAPSTDATFRGFARACLKRYVNWMPKTTSKRWIKWRIEAARLFSLLFASSAGVMVTNHYADAEGHPAFKAIDQLTSARKIKKMDAKLNSQFEPR